MHERLGNQRNHAVDHGAGGGGPRRPRLQRPVKRQHRVVRPGSSGAWIEVDQAVQNGRIQSWNFARLLERNASAIDVERVDGAVEIGYVAHHQKAQHIVGSVPLVRVDAVPSLAPCPAKGDEEERLAVLVTSFRGRNQGESGFFRYHGLKELDHLCLRQVLEAVLNVERESLVQHGMPFD
jgi:hypothetical protein